MSASRSSILSLALFLAVSGAWRRVVSARVLVVGVVSTSLAWGIRKSPTRLVGDVLSDPSMARLATGSGRTVIWRSFVDRFSDGEPSALIFGSGLGSSTFRVEEADFFARDPHNLPLDVLTVFGLFGALVIGACVLWGVRWAMKPRRDQLGLALLVALAGAGMFNSIWRFSAIIWLNSLVFCVPLIYPRLWPRHPV